MPEASTFQAWAESLLTMNYYAILRVGTDSTPAQVKTAFHAFALRCHPDRYIDDPPEVAAAAAEVFKRGVEAYNILSDPGLREKYNNFLRAGKLRMEPHEILRAAPKAEVRTLEMVARNPAAKQHARRADLLIGARRYDEARIQLISALQNDYGNQELQERLRQFYADWGKGGL